MRIPGGRVGEAVSSAAGFETGPVRRQAVFLLRLLRLRLSSHMPVDVFGITED